MLSVDTIVRTSQGPKSIGEIEEGDLLYDEKDNLVECTDVGDPEVGYLEVIDYRQFGHTTQTQFECTSTHQLHLKASSGVYPYKLKADKGYFVIFFTKCNRQARKALLRPYSIPPDVSAKLASRNLTERLEDFVENSICLCKGFKKRKLSCDDEADANCILNILLSENYRAIDPLLVFDGEDFQMSVEDVRNICQKNIRIKLSRCPLRSVPSDDPPTWNELPIDPYFLGLYLGDGCINQGATVVNSSRNVIKWIDDYIAELNSRANPADALFYRSEYTSNKVYDKIQKFDEFGVVDEDDFFEANVNCYRIRIASSTGRDNSLVKGLHELGLYDSKAGGIPDLYKRASESVRLALIAGLIDSDGSLSQGSNYYAVSQNGEQHRKIVYDLREIALSCGIYTDDVNVSYREPNHLIRDKESYRAKNVATYRVHLKHGSDKLLPFLRIPYKHMHMDKYENRQEVDRSVFKICPGKIGRFRRIELNFGETNHLQLSNRGIVSPH